MNGHIHKLTVIGLIKKYSDCQEDVEYTEKLTSCFGYLFG